VFVALAASNALALAQQPVTGRAGFPGTIDGFVTDTNLVPLVEATVSIVGSNVQVVTGENGRFRISKVAPGAYHLLVRRIGFEPALSNIQVPGADTVRMSILLERASTRLDTVTITGRHISWKADEFLARRKFGEGQFITQEEIEKRNTPWVSGLLETLAGVNVVPTRSSHVAINRRAGCAFQVMLDGMPTDNDLDALPSPKMLLGIEVYLGPATMPLQFKRPGGKPSCGVIMIWTRDQ
jgi:hypothetical protein